MDSQSKVAPLMNSWPKTVAVCMGIVCVTIIIVCALGFAKVKKAYDEDQDRIVRCGLQLPAKECQCLINAMCS